MDTEARGISTTPTGREWPSTAVISWPEAQRWLDAMDRAIEDFAPPVALRDPDNEFWIETKMSDRFLTPALRTFFTDMSLPVLLRKKNYYKLVHYLEPSEVHRDVVDVLDGIVTQASIARSETTP